MRSVVIIVTLTIAALVGAQSFPPPIAWLNADSMDFVVNAVGQQFTGSGSLQYQAPTNNKQPYLFHVSASAMGAGAEAWTSLSNAPSRARLGGDQKYAFAATVQSPEGCFTFATGMGPGNGSIACSPWTQQKRGRRQAGSTWSQKCRVEEGFGDITIQATAYVGAAKNQLNSVDVAGNAVGTTFTAQLNFTSLQPTPPTSGVFQPPSCSAAERRPLLPAHPLNTFLRALGVPLS